MNVNYCHACIELTNFSLLPEQADALTKRITPRLIGVECYFKHLVYLLKSLTVLLFSVHGKSRISNCLFL